ncbi:MAG: hypothetical protein AB7W37_06345 [Syntrophobacteraceae bacterium]|jgi:hypothetical protein
MKNIDATGGKGRTGAQGFGEGSRHSIPFHEGKDGGENPENKPYCLQLSSLGK